MPYNGIPIEPRQNDPGPVLRQTADHTRSGLIYDTAIPLIRPGCAVQTNGTTSLIPVIDLRFLRDGYKRLGLIERVNQIEQFLIGGV